jgi:hypothetical protein
MLIRFQYNACVGDALWVTILELIPACDEEPWDPRFGPSYFKNSEDFIALAVSADLPKGRIEEIREDIKSARESERGSCASEVFDLQVTQLQMLGFTRFRILTVE